MGNCGSKKQHVDPLPNFLSDSIPLETQKVMQSKEVEELKKKLQQLEAQFRKERDMVQCKKYLFFHSPLPLVFGQH